ncbi:MAG: bifunctional enoyl-CoA hydratase/phosphate acetyltransferase [Chromatiales bacterium]|jgi:phosphate acetyltransferase
MSNLSSENSAGFAADAADTQVPHAERAHEKYEQLIARTKDIPPIPTAVVWPCEGHALAGPVDAAKEGIIDAVLIGPEARIRKVAEEAGLDLDGLSIVDVETEEAAAAQAVSMAHDGKVAALMKGSLHTDVLMHEVVAGKPNLRTGRRISHVFGMDVPNYEDVLFITDAAINIFPDVETKRDIVQNAIDLFWGLRGEAPRVAILSAVEVVNPKIPGTTDAAILCKMADRGQITGGILDGPLAMDNAINPEAAKIKGIDSPVAGRAQILVVPDLEAGNMLAKNLIFLAGADAAGIVVGAAVPIILTSRADSVRTRLASTAVGALFAHHLVQEKQRQAT